MLASAVELGGDGRAGRILRDPANRRLSGPEVLHKLDPGLQAWSSESARFNPSLADDRQV
jgi:hypothetical protein